jgi:dihydroorotate dehydrogenase (NAD+) catalytic subunit
VAGVKRTLAVDLGGLTLPSPIMIASGCAGSGRETTGLVDPRKIGAAVTRTITVQPRKGSPTPRIAETPSSIVWETGLQNPGLDAFVSDELPRLAKGGPPIVVSIGGRTLEDFVRLTSALQGRPEVVALEVYLAEPDDELGRRVLGTHPDRVAEIVGACARMSLVPVFAKLPWAPPLLGDLAIAAVRAGAHGLVVVDAPAALAVDAPRLSAALGSVTGRFAGPAMRPLTLAAVYEVARVVPDAPIVAVGGVRTGRDTVELLLAGASAVQVGTATLVDPAAPVTIGQGVGRYLQEKNLASPADLRGRLRAPSRDMPAPEVQV